jgi:predicted phage gp36 major capsid-like protein
LPARFRARAAWFLNKLILNDVLKDANTAAAIWYPSGLAGLGDGSKGVIGSLIGNPTGEASGMASVLTTGSKVAVIGDPAYFLIVDHVAGMTVEAIPHLFSGGTSVPTGQRGLWVGFRNSSRVIDASAFRTIVTG